MVASSHNDAHLTNFLEEEFLDEQVRAIKKLGDQITRLKRAGPEGLGEYIFDKDLSSQTDSNHFKIYKLSIEN